MHGRVLSKKMASILKKEIRALKNQGKSHTTLLLHRSDFYSEFGLSSKDIRAGYQDIEANDFKKEDEEDLQQEEYRESLEEKQEKIERFFNNDLGEDEQGYQPDRIDALEYLSKQADEKRKE